MTPLASAALEYHRRGFCPIPVSDEKRPPPRFGWKAFQRDRPKEEILPEWFAPPSITGVAIVLGMVSGDLVVRDFDAPGAYDAWRSANPDDAARLPTVKTGRADGFQVYGRRAGVATCALGDGELRSNGSYVVAPPSRHPSGAVYRWLVPLTGPVPPLPASLLIAHAIPAGLPEDPSTHTYSLCQIAAEQDTAAIVERWVCTGPGQRNDRRFQLVRELRAVLPESVDGAVLRPLFDRWFNHSRAFMDRQNYGAEWLDFLRNWKTVRHPRGASWEQALAELGTTPPPPECALYEGHEPAQRLIHLAAVLQRTHGTEPFPLSCRKAGQAIGLNHDGAAELLRALVFDGLLTIAKPGDRFAGGKATLYRFIGRQDGNHP